MQQRDKVHVTQEGLEKLQEELEFLRTVRRPEVVRAIAAAREEGDLRENAGYDAAKHDQGFIEARIRELEDMVRRAEIIQEPGTSGDGTTVKLGSTVTIELDGAQETYTIVGRVEAKPLEGRISNESPIGKALLGRREGQDVTIETPANSRRARILKVEG